MANKFWTPGSTDWSQTNNWASTQGGATGAGAPANTNDVYLLGGAYSVAAYDASAVTLASMTIMDGFGGQQTGMTIGDTSQALKVNGTTLRIQSQRLSSVRLDGTWTTVTLEKFTNGFIYFQGATTLTNLRQGPNCGFVTMTSSQKVSLFDTCAQFLIADDSSSPVDLVLVMGAGASGECQRKIHTLSCTGRLTLTGAATGTASSGTSRWYVQAGATLDIRSSGDINEIHALPGSTVTGEFSPGYGTKPTITSLIRYQGSDVRLPSSLFTITNNLPVGVPTGT